MAGYAKIERALQNGLLPGVKWNNYISHVARETLEESLYSSPRGWSYLWKKKRQRKRRASATLWYDAVALFRNIRDKSYQKWSSVCPAIFFHMAQMIKEKSISISEDRLNRFSHWLPLYKIAAIVRPFPKRNERRDHQRIETTIEIKKRWRTKTAEQLKK